MATRSHRKRMRHAKKHGRKGLKTRKYKGGGSLTNFFKSSGTLQYDAYKKKLLQDIKDYDEIQQEFFQGYEATKENILELRGKISDEKVANLLHLLQKYHDKSKIITKIHELLDSFNETKSNAEIENLQKNLKDLADELRLLAPNSNYIKTLNAQMNQ